MLDISAVRRGTIVYRVEFADTTEIFPEPVVTQWEVTSCTKRTMTVRSLSSDKRGRRRQIDKAKTEIMLRRYYPSHKLAVVAAESDAFNTIRHAEFAINVARSTIQKLSQLYQEETCGSRHCATTAK